MFYKMSKATNRIYIILLGMTFAVGLSHAGSRWDREAGAKWAPITPENRAEVYARTSRSATVHVNRNRVIREISPAFLGINLSCFSDTTDVWRDAKIPETLRYAGVGAMRFPGGAETGYYHWQHPGVNGYEDFWEPAADRAKIDPDFKRCGWPRRSGMPIDCS